MKRLESRGFLPFFKKDEKIVKKSKKAFDRGETIVL